MTDWPGDRKLSTSDPTAASAPARPIVLVGGGERAVAWLHWLQRSARLRVIASAIRAPHEAATELPHCESLDEAIARHPDAAFAVALPPRAALDGALRLAAAGATAVVEAPLHEALIDIELDPAADGVRVAHGWVTLRGVRALAPVIQRAGGGRLRIEIAGLPEAGHGDPAEVLVHAAALVRALLPHAGASSARYADGGALEVDVVAPSARGGWTAQLRLLTSGQRLAVEMQGHGETARWSWEPDRESVTRDGQPLVAAHATPAGAVRALAQLLPEAARGDGLREAAAALRLARDCRALLPTPLAIGARPLRQSASIAQRRPRDLLGRLGLRGQLAPGGGSPPQVLAEAVPTEPFELWAFRAGVKPVAFLTVRPDEVERTLAFFGDVPVVRRNRRVRVADQDCWTDRRDQGEPRVELYISRDAGLAERAAYLQAEVDPSRALDELGALLGYPACCVQAFAQQDDRANNSRNRYCSQARTPAAPTPWPWELNNLHTLIAPFYPCSYRCEHARTWARATLEALARHHPQLVDTLRARLFRPVLYFDHDHQLVFDGEGTEDRISYRAVALPPCASPQLGALATAIAHGDRLAFDDRQLLVEHRGQVVLRLERTDPALGFIAPFGIA